MYTLYSMTDSISCVLKCCSASAFTYTAWVGVVWGRPKNDVARFWLNTDLLSHIVKKSVPFRKWRHKLMTDTPPPQSHRKVSCLWKVLPTLKAKTLTSLSYFTNAQRHTKQCERFRSTGTVATGRLLPALQQPANYRKWSISLAGCAQNDTETPLFCVNT